MVCRNRFFQHLLIGFGCDLIDPAVFLDLFANHFDEQLQLRGRHFHIRQLFKIFRAENIFFLSSIENALNLIVAQGFLDHFRNGAIHAVGIQFCSSAHLADKACDGHEALCQRRFAFRKFPGGLTNIITEPHTLDSF